MNNDELIAAGHELAKCLDNEPLLDIAKMLSKMATQLDVTTAALREKTKQCEKLAEENAELKNALEWLYEAVSMPDSGPIPDKYYSAVTNAAAVMHETPATDAFLREVRASAVDAVCLKISNSIVICRQDEMIGLDEAVNIASDFAVDLRQGGAA
ncbi:hypothetical protein G187_gp16 [Cronobacter phage ENT47670]|uniref:hypothetical protein n=1 Tax=Cronobacter phage ENT47670 TaxID=984186 RepID=UPI000201F594|nr:hypothetical protein G187_gp16 [Cronobacter phage ENT47670]ADZ13649.1 hypothetical protein [Cronobacter phage ENT47670]